MREEELGALYYNDYDTDFKFGEFCYNKGKSDERAKQNEFFNFDEVIRIECDKARADGKAEVLEEIKEIIATKTNPMYWIEQMISNK